VARQVALINDFVTRGQHTLVHIAKDEDVSGAVSPFERPGLGPWLSRPNEWDILVVPKIDRLSRSQLHVQQLLEWARNHGKSIYSLDIQADITDRLAGGVVVAVLASVAEAEREQIRERTKASFQKIVREGRWNGGKPPYGYKPEPIPGGGYRLVVNEPQATVIRHVVNQVLAGKSLRSIAMELNKNGTPTHSGKGEWRISTLSSMLKGQAILGRMTVNNRVNPTVLYDENGPIQRAEPIITLAEWSKVGQLLNGPTERRGKARWALYGVGYCECGMPLSTSKSGGGKYAAIYTRCMSGADVSTEKCRRGKMIKADLLTDLTYDAFIRALGPAPMTETVIIPGQDHTAEIADLEAHLARLQEDRLDGLYDGPGRELYVTTFKRLTARLAALQQAPTTTDTAVTRATGQTYAEHWATLTTTEERNDQLRAAGVRVITTRGPAAEYNPDGEPQPNGAIVYDIDGTTLIGRVIHEHALMLFPLDQVMTPTEAQNPA
jgi:site-specific DNA recombinase